MNTNCTIVPLMGIGRRLESLVRKAVLKFNLLDSPRLAIALSGGKDSLALLYLLKTLSGRGFPPFELHAIHVTGKFSCGPMVTLGYLTDVCKTLDVPLSVVSSEQQMDKLECYSCSRERRRLLFSKAKELGFSTIAFGHHRDDSIETLLMNLLQKGEFAANLPKVPMIDYGVTIIRPLILISEKDIISFAKSNDFMRIVCQCPVGQKSRRKDVKNLITEMEEYFPHVRENLAHAAMNYGSDKALKK